MTGQSDLESQDETQGKHMRRSYWNGPVRASTTSMTANDGQQERRMGELCAVAQGTTEMSARFSHLLGEKTKVLV